MRVPVTGRGEGVEVTSGDGTPVVEVRGAAELAALAGTGTEAALDATASPSTVVAAVVVARLLGQPAIHTVDVRAARRAVAVLDALDEAGADPGPLGGSRWP